MEDDKTPGENDDFLPSDLSLQGTMKEAFKKQ